MVHSKLCRIALPAILSACILLPAHPAGAFDSTQIQLAVDTANTSQDGLLTLYGGVRLGGELGLPVASGDMNHDGHGDVAFCEMYATSGVGTRPNNGQVDIYISDGSDSGVVDAGTNPASISTLIGRSAGDLLGTSVAMGDVNGDGFADLVVSATGSDGPNGTRTNCGALYVVPGSAGFNLHADLGATGGTLPGGMSVIYGPQAQGRFGIWVDTGDVDGDGIQDIIVGADQLNSDDHTLTHIGGAFIIFGQKSLPQVIDLASPPPGLRVTRILGVNQEDHWGACVHVGDINNDGIGDLVISAAIDRDSASYVDPSDQTSGHNVRGASDGETRPGCGEVYVVYGSSVWPDQISLKTPPPGATHLIGAHQGDLLGSQLFSADVNGDGKRDLVIGAITAQAPDGKGATGAVYVVYGSPSIIGATIDMLTPSASGLQVSAIYGENASDCAGDSVRAYDINGDGMAEIFVGSPDNTFSIDGTLRNTAGDTKIIFGRSTPLPPVVKLYDLPADIPIYRLAGGGDDYEFSYRLTGIDVDGDGYVDYIANAMHGNGSSGVNTHAGNVYVFSGKKLSAKLGLFNQTPQLATATLSSSNGQVVQQAPAGQTGLSITVTGSNFSPGIQLFINGMPVSSAIPSGGALQPTRYIGLDAYPDLRDTVGPLVVTAQNTNPDSPLSNSLTAGTLTGPQITSVVPKVKPSGALILKINGAGFTAGATVAVTGGAGNSIPVASTNFSGGTFAKAKIVGQSFPSGTSITVRVVLASGVRSNPVNVTLN